MIAHRHSANILLVLHFSFAFHTADAATRFDKAGRVCAVSIGGPRIQSAPGCKAMHKWTVTNTCDAQAKVRYTDDKGQQGLLFVQANANTNLECCEFGTITCGRSNWTYSYDN